MNVMNDIPMAHSIEIEQRIFQIRGMRVMLSIDLADLYEVEPRVLVQAVKRNIERFPADFMFQLSDQEFAHLKSQIVTSSWGGIRRATPYAFTEQGVAMLSGILNSPRARGSSDARLRFWLLNGWHGAQTISISSCPSSSKSFRKAAGLMERISD